MSARIYKDLVHVVSTTNGTGNFALGSAATGCQAFDVFPNGSIVGYRIRHANGTEYETGYGTVQGDGTTLERTEVHESSNGDELVDFTNGTKSVVCTLVAKEVTDLIARQIIAGDGLEGGGDLTEDRTLTVVADDATIVVSSEGVRVGVVQDANIGNGVSGSKITPDFLGTASVTVDDEVEDDVTNVLTLVHAATAGAPANGIGTGILLRAHNDVPALVDVARLAAILTDAGDGSEDSVLAVHTQSGGNLVEVIRFGDTTLLAAGKTLDVKAGILDVPDGASFKIDGSPLEDEIWNAISVNTASTPNMVKQAANLSLTSTNLATDVTDLVLPLVTGDWDVFVAAEYQPNNGTDGFKHDFGAEGGLTVSNVRRRCRIYTTSGSLLHSATTYTDLTSDDGVSGTNGITYELRVHITLTITVDGSIRLRVAKNGADNAGDPTFFADGRIWAVRKAA